MQSSENLPTYLTIKWERKNHQTKKIVKRKNIRLWQNSNTHIWTKLKKSNHGKKLKLWQKQKQCCPASPFNLSITPHFTSLKNISFYRKIGFLIVVPFLYYSCKCLQTYSYSYIQIFFFFKRTFLSCLLLHFSSFTTKKLDILSLTTIGKEISELSCKEKLWNF